VNVACCERESVAHDLIVGVDRTEVIQHQRAGPSVYRTDLLERPGERLGLPILVAIRPDGSTLRG